MIIKGNREYMWIVKFLKKSLEGRGMYSIFMVIFSWTYAAVLLGVLLYEIFLYAFKVKYKNSDFENNEEKRKNQ